MLQITIVLVDDHQLILDAWTQMLNHDAEFEVVGSARDSEEALQLIGELHPNVVLCDINLCPQNGLELTRYIGMVSPFSKVIGVSMYSIPAYAKKMMKEGAWGYVTKNSPAEELKQAIVEVAHGKKFICNEIQYKVARAELCNEAENGIDLLTQKELAVISSVKDGLSSREIALKMDISIKTVEVHRYNILKKLKLKNTAMLITFIHKWGF